MDISDSYDQSEQQQQQQQQQNEQHMQQDPMSDSSNILCDMQQQQQQQQQLSQLFTNNAIPLPAPNQSLKQMQSGGSGGGNSNGQLFPAAAVGVPVTTTPTSNAPSSTADIEIDSMLLQQFSCLGTTDHEDLVKQFQTIMNNQMNEDSARFFLEMSNWNLQTAVGCYLDFCNFQTLPSMKIVQQQQMSEHQQAWRLQNIGTEEWPKGCYLSSPTQTRRIELPAIRPGETCDILVNLPVTQPAVPVMWRLCTPNGWYFGETLWMVPPGFTPNNAQEDLASRMSMLHTSSSSSISSSNSSTGPTTNITNPESYPQANVVISVNIE